MTDDKEVFHIFVFRPLLLFELFCSGRGPDGQIQSAELHETNKEKVLDIIAEDNTKYQIYLSDSNKVEAIKNIDTDEWVIKSER